MIIIYLIIVAISSFPLLITIKRIKKYKTVANSGITAKAQIIKKELKPIFRGRPIVELQLQYKHPQFDEPITSEATTANNSYKVGDFVAIAFEKNKPKIFIIGDEKGYYPMLGFAIIMLLFSCFAVYMIRDMVINGY